MIIFNSDLDNTLIFSYKHNIGNEKINVEMYQGRQISFVTDKTYQLIKKVKDKMIFVPTTTRTIEQYKRINLEIGNIKYALVCNGGILLVDGQEDDKWYQDSLKLIENSREEMEKAYRFLDTERRRNFELRNIRELFLFTKCDNPMEVVKELSEKLNCDAVDVFNNGNKVYVVPKMLNKGGAVLRLKKRLGGRKIIAAGDSEFDISMLRAADVAIAPQGLENRIDSSKISGKIVYMDENAVFSDQVLTYVLSNEMFYLE